MWSVAHKKRIAHRDIKPANILVVSRFPLHIKLADFGLAQDRTDLMTRCGTLYYIAPEVHFNEVYTTAVDIWSIGVVVLQYAYGFPEEGQGCQRSTRIRARSWWLRIVDEINRGYSHPLTDLLSGHMLRMDPQERLPAGRCLEKGSELGLFDGTVSDSGNATPTQQTALNPVVSDDDGSTTIVMGAVWGAQSSSDIDHDMRTYHEAERTTELLEPPPAQVPGGLDGFLDSFGPAVEQLVGNIEAPLELRSRAAGAQSTWAQSTCARRHKRPRSTARGSARGSSRRTRIKR